MSNEAPDILIVDDDPDVVRAARLLLERRGFLLRTADGPEAALIALARRRPDVVLLDLNFARGRTSGEEGLSLLDRMIAADPAAMIVIITGHSGTAIAVAAMRAGACDVVIKPWNNDRLLASVERAVKQARQVGGPSTQAMAPMLLGEDAAIARARDLIARVAPTMAGVFLSGPSGTGKTLAAEMIHRRSTLAEHPPVRLEGELVELSQLTGLAGRTVLLENVDRVAREVQPRLAEALHEARAIATTRLGRDALREALVGDLLYRLNTIEIDLPPLAERSGDILPLARHFLALSAARHGRTVLPLSEEAAAIIASHGWPDNLHRLQQAIERAVVLARGDTYGAADFSLAPVGDVPDAAGTGGDLNLERHERRLVLAALKRHAFNISRAAEELGLTRAALYRRMDKHGI